MSGFCRYHISQIVDLRRRVEETLKQSRGLQDAAQRLAGILYEEFEEATVLVRVFGTVSFKELPERDKEFVRRLATSRGCAAELDDQTAVISLLGTRGKKSKWDDRYGSERRLGIPLLSVSFIQTVPLVSVLMGHAAPRIAWIDKQKSKILVTSLGQMARMVYVEDAATALTGDGFKTVPAQDFVRDQNVKTVMGLGGTYLNGAFVAIVIFTNEIITSQQARKFMPLVNSFKTATTGLVMNGQIFG